jgi:hypothetical protein
MDDVDDDAIDSNRDHSSPASADLRFRDTTLDGAESPPFFASALSTPCAIA